MSQVSVEYCLFSPLTFLSISHGTGIEGQGSGRVSLWSVCSPFMFKSMYLDFEIKCLILVTTKN